MTEFEDHLAEFDDHGHTLAAWVMVAILLLGAAIMSLAVAFPNVPLFIGGAVVLVVGLVTGRVMVGAGYGKNGAKTKARAATH